MHIAVAADHAGFPLKAEVIRQLRALGHEVLDLGPAVCDPNDDYPDFSAAVGQAVQQSRVQRGIVLCGSGVGAAIAANKLRGIRAGACHDTYSVRQGVEHVNMNLLCLGARIVGPAIAADLVAAFAAAQHLGEQRHARRLRKLQALEDQSQTQT